MAPLLALAQALLATARHRWHSNGLFLKDASATTAGTGLNFLAHSTQHCWHWGHCFFP
jgi:hypothetical protein